MKADRTNVPIQKTTRDMAVTASGMFSPPMDLQDFADVAVLEKSKAVIARFKAGKNIRHSRCSNKAS